LELQPAGEFTALIRWDILDEMVADCNRVSSRLRSLTPLQEKVLRLYFGLGCRRSHSASEIAAEFRVSPHVIAGILGGAQRKLAKVGLTPAMLREAAQRRQGSGVGM